MKIMAKGILIGFKNGGAVDVETDSGHVKIEEMYRLTNCTTLDVVRMNDELDMWVDDEGLMKSKNFVQAYTLEDKPLHTPLAGNILILSHDDDGNTIGLTKEQMEYVADNLKFGLYGYTN